MQPSYALLPVTSYPKTVGRILLCYDNVNTDNVKTTISNQAITGQKARMLSQYASADNLSMHAITQSQPWEVSHAIPAYINTDKLSQHAVAQS